MSTIVISVIIVSVISNSNYYSTTNPIKPKNEQPVTTGNQNTESKESPSDIVTVPIVIPTLPTLPIQIQPLKIPEPFKPLKPLTPLKQIKPDDSPERQNEIMRENEKIMQQNEENIRYNENILKQREFGSSNQKQSQSKVSTTTLYKRALDLVNKDRTDNGLPPVFLSNNNAALIHAQDILKTRQISHWMTNGEKPYMTYTRYGGTGNVAQNIAFSGYSDVEQCKQAYVICEKIDPIDAIEQSEYDLMYNDAASNWGHRDNILDPHHTDVSFGIAYDDYTFVFVQNFEDNYIEFVRPIGENPNEIRIIGNTLEGIIQNISIYSDPYPTSQVYNIHKNDDEYGMGRLVAVVAPPLPPDMSYKNSGGYSLIVAKSMSQSGNTFNAVFDMSSIASQRGVYTITIWLENDGTSFPATSHSIFVE